jgi:SNF2 family DNA or RNA helicase
MKLRSNGLKSLLITDGVGVGKTISAGYILFHGSHIAREPSVVICPPILVEKWRMELKNRFDLDSRLANSKEGFDLMCDEISSGVDWDIAPIYICSFSLLSREKGLDIPQVGVILFDEVHYVRNNQTNAYENSRRLASKAEYRIGMSATPINNSLSDIASIVSVLVPTLHFKDADELFSDIWDSPVLDSFSSMVTRFLKEQVSDQFTKRKVHTEVVEYPNEYMLFVNNCIESRMLERRSDAFFEKIVFFRLASSSPRAFLNSFNALEEGPRFDDPKIARLCELLSERKSERWLIFTEFKETAKLIEDSIQDRIVLVLSGDSDSEERAAIVNIFHSEPNSVIVMTPVGSEGLDFQICSNLVNYDLHWNPMKIEQRIGRIDRIGQSKSEINIHNFVAKGSIDDMVLEKIGDKLSLVSNSFAEIMPIVEGRVRETSMMDDDSLSAELDSAKEMINAAQFYNRFSSSDLDVIKNVNPENCDTDEWLWADWTHPTPWIGNCIRWSQRTRESSENFAEMLEAYSTKSK